MTPLHLAAPWRTPDGPTSGVEPGKGWGRDAVVGVLLGLAALGLNRAVAAALHVRHPTGTDTALWAFGAMNYEVGAPVRTPPFFPMLTAWIRTGDTPAVVAGGWVALAAFGMLAPMGFLVARSLGALRGAAAAAGLLAVLLPAVLVLGLQCQPDALTALWFLAIALVGVKHVTDRRRQPGPTDAVLLALAALAPLVREHGLLLAGSGAVLLLLGPRAGWVRGLEVGLLAGAACLAPGLAGQPPSLPWHTPWMTRTTMAVDGSLPMALASWLPQLEETERARVQEALASGDRLRMALVWARHALEIAGWEWAWVLVALPAALLVGAGPRRRGAPRDLRGLAAAVTLAPVLAGLAVWSERRHVAVGLPLAMALLASTTRRGRLWSAVAAGTAAVLFVGTYLAAPERPLDTVRGERTQAERLAAFGAALCALVEPGDMATGPHLSDLAFCPLPYRQMEDDLLPTAADWKTWAILNPPRAPGWQRVHLAYDLLPVFRYLPEIEGAERPCAGSRPVPVLPHDVATRGEIPMDPRCDPILPDLEERLSRVPPPTAEDLRIPLPPPLAGVDGEHLDEEEPPGSLGTPPTSDPPPPPAGSAAPPAGSGPGPGPGSAPPGP